MSESEASMPDLSKVVELLLEKPELVDKIRSLVNSEAPSTETVNAAPNEIVVPPKATETAAPPKPPAKDRAASFFSQTPGDREQRHKLIGALKPYLSDNRAKVLDSFEAVVGIIDAIRPGLGG